MSKRIDARVDVPATKGSSTSPKTGRTRHRKDRRRSSSTSDRNVLSSADAAHRDWLVAEARKWNMPDPDAHLSKTGATWQLTSRGAVVGRLQTPQVYDRRVDLIQKLCEQVSVVRADLGRAINAPWQEISRTLHVARDRIDEIVNACARELICFELGATKEEPNLYAVAGVADEASRARSAQQAEDLRAKKPPKDETEDQAKQRAAALARAEIAAQFKFSGAVLSVLSQRARSAHIVWTKDKRRRRFPLVRQGQPIPLRAADGWSVTRVKGSFILEFKIGEGKSGRWQLKIHPGGGNAIAAVRELVEETATKRDAKLVWDDGRKRWVIAMAIGRKRRPPPELGANPLTMVVRLGMRRLLTAWLSDGRSIPITAGDRTGATLVGILERKQALLGLKQSKQRGMTELARGPSAVRLNKSKRRRLGALGQKERAFVANECKNIAAFVANIAEREGATRVIVQLPAKPFAPEDEKRMGHFIVAALRRFPMGELSSKIVWALDKRGLPSEVSDLGYDACTCPGCDHVDARAHDSKTQLFCCTQEGCSFSEPINSDFVAAMNAMRRSGVSTAEMDRMLVVARAMVRAVRQKREQAAE